MQSRRRPSQPRGFTLIELLVVIGIIVLLAAILLPVVSQIRKTAYNTSTQGEMQRIMTACESYYHDFNAYPGPIANVYLANGLKAGADPSPSKFTTASGKPVTSSENVVLGLLGILNPPTSGSPAVTANYSSPGIILLPPSHDVLSLGSTTLNISKTYHYIDFSPQELDTGPANTLTVLTGITLADSEIPEFIDQFPDAMPILYLRANVGATGTPAVNSADTAGAGVLVQYNYMDLSPYGCNVQTTNGPQSLNLNGTYFTTLATDVSTNILSTDITAPYTDWNGITPVSPATTPPTYNGYLTNPNIAGPNPPTTGGVPRGPDGFMLICAGKDRTYGTSDDTIITP